MALPSSTATLPRLANGVLALGLVGGLATYAIWPWLPLPGRAAPPRTIVLYGFSILAESIDDGVFPAFAEEWRARTGEDVELVSSFAGSGTITNQIVMGVPADVAILSLELDALRLADTGRIPHESWRALPHGGIVNRTPFVIVVREGNPHGIHDFEDLARPGIGVVHPDPLTSGGANWAILAEYGAGARAHPEDPEAGEKLLRGIWRNVVAQAASARAARTQFDNGFGDALVTYEQEALSDRAKGRLRGEIVYPSSTVLSEHVLVVVERNVDASERELVHAFASFLWSERAQRLFVQHGFRSVDERLNGPESGFGAIEDPFLVADWGGWQAARESIIEGTWKSRILPELGR